MDDLGRWVGISANGVVRPVADARLDGLMNRSAVCDARELGRLMESALLDAPAVDWVGVNPNDSLEEGLAGWSPLKLLAAVLLLVRFLADLTVTVDGIDAKASPFLGDDRGGVDVGAGNFDRVV